MDRQAMGCGHHSASEAHSSRGRKSLAEIAQSQPPKFPKLFLKRRMLEPLRILNNLGIKNLCV